MWRPTWLAQRVAGVASWTVELDAPDLVVSEGGRTARVNVLIGERIVVKRGLPWASVLISDPQRGNLVLKGLSNAGAQTLKEALARCRAAHERRLRINAVLQRFAAQLIPVRAWHDAVQRELSEHEQRRHWLSQELMERLAQQRPSDALAGISDEPEISGYIRSLPPLDAAALQLWPTDLCELARRRNEELMESERHASAEFFRTVEKSPLTDEQVRAVVCYDNRVQVIAAAGSGKTSTMVARAGYALHRGYVRGEEILLLAFNKDAAAELQERVRERLLPLGLPAEGIVARTFHAFGLDVIGAATGRKPALAAWLDQGEGIPKLQSLVDALKDTDPQFRLSWDLYRLVFTRDLPSVSKEFEDVEDWDRARDVNGFRTLQGEVVRSRGEWLIANWLFYNGVRYEYERPYEHDTATAQHRQYHPDFYLVDIGVYYEHWALDTAGKPPEQFGDYLQQMQWKKELHARHGTRLLETTSAQVWSGEAFAYLTQQLTELGLALDPNPDRPTPGREPVREEALLSTFRTFLTHTKSNRLTRDALQRRLDSGAVGAFRFRHAMFLELFLRLWEAWDAALRQAGAIDFEDMLNLAADHLEAGRWRSPYKLVMVDEFQDASSARAQLTRALVAPPDRFLFAVGDDWQSINRFAGADLSVMTNFGAWFGRHQALRLERTFRCPQQLCDISGGFVQANPAQLRKTVRSTTPAVGGAVLELHQVEDERLIASTILTLLVELHKQIDAGAVPTGKNGKVSVFMLGRYRRDREYLPDISILANRMDVTFNTVHGSKGLEADYVILPRMVAGGRGFPSGIVDDPVLQLAMPAGDNFPLAEERRLFYVALTRARRQAILITIEHRVSPFILDLIRAHGLQPAGRSEQMQAPAIRACPRCAQGQLVQRRGRYGAFWGCSRFPNCTHTEKS